MKHQYQTHLDAYEGEFITTTGKPSVRDRLYGLKMYGKSVQSGTPTPESPVPIQNVPSNFNITTCGANLFTTNNWDSVLAEWSSPFTTITGSNSFYTTKNVAGMYQQNGFIFKVKSNMIYSFSFDFLLEIFKEGGFYDNGKVFFYDLTNGLVQDAENTFLRLNISKETGRKVMSVTMPSNCTKIGIVFNFHITNVAPDYHTSAKMTMTDCEFVIGDQVLPEYLPYSSTTTNFSIKDKNNNLHELCSLPDGTTDSIENGKIIKRVEKKIVTSPTVPGNWNIDLNSYPTYDALYMLDGAAKPAESMAIDGYCNILQVGTVASNKTAIIALNKNNGKYYYLMLPLGTLPERTTAAARAWIQNQITTHGQIVFLSKYIIAQTYDLHPDELEKLKQIKSVYPSTNIFTSANIQPNLSCNIRKLGNRPFVEQTLTDEGGNFLVDENGNNIIGVT